MARTLEMKQLSPSPQSRPSTNQEARTRNQSTPVTRTVMWRTGGGRDSTKPRVLTLTLIPTGHCQSTKQIIVK